MMKITDLSKCKNFYCPPEVDFWSCCRKKDMNCESNADLPKAVIPPQKPGQVKIWKPMTTENFN